MTKKSFEAEIKPRIRLNLHLFEVFQVKTLEEYLNETKYYLTLKSFQKKMKPTESKSWLTELQYTGASITFFT